MFPIGDDNTQRRSLPVVTYALIAANLVFFLIELSGGGRKQMLIPFTQGAVPEIDIDGGRIVIDPVAAGLVSDDDDDEGPGDEDGRP